MLDQYVNLGVTELEPEKLTPLLKLKYHDSIPDAVADLGPAAGIRAAFLGFQKALYYPAITSSESSYPSF